MRCNGVSRKCGSADAGDGVSHVDIQLTTATEWMFVVPAGVQATFMRNCEVR
jgi:hypothetical protein